MSLSCGSYHTAVVSADGDLYTSCIYILAGVPLLWLLSHSCGLCWWRSLHYLYNSRWCPSLVATITLLWYLLMEISTPGVRLKVGSWVWLVLLLGTQTIPDRYSYSYNNWTDKPLLQHCDFFFSLHNIHLGEPSWESCFRFLWRKPHHCPNPGKCSKVDTQSINQA